VCTRRCRFCGVRQGRPAAVDPDEPGRVASVVRDLGLRHVVVTSVTRDDLPDGGARQFARTVHAVRRITPDATIETLIPDFLGNPDSLETVLDSGVDVLNHNVETVPRLYPIVRPGADFLRSIRILERAKSVRPDVLTKSGLMAGLGETPDEMAAVFETLAGVRCDALTIGQYLMPAATAYPVREYIQPSRFREYESTAIRRGIPRVLAGPYVRSSYQAETMMKHAMRSGV